MDNEHEQIAELVQTEVNHAVYLLHDAFTFENISDAAETLARAANRLAPDGHSVHLQRNEWETAERLGTGR
jgi:hypothetical protein